MHYDLLVIGGGPGGYVAAIYAAKKGMKVGLVEKGELGGTCLNRGCIPTKALSHGASLYQSIKNAGDFGVFPENVRVDWRALQDKKAAVIGTLRRGVENLLKANGVTVFRGEAVVESPDTVRVLYRDGEQRLTAESLILATGSEPVVIPFPGHDLPGVITSEEALSLSEIPSSLLIVGGGVIGMEMASIYNALGSEVAVVEMLPHILPRVDEEISAELKRQLEKRGVRIYTETRLESVEREGGKLKACIDTSGQSRYISAEKVLVAVGRRPVTGAFEGLGLKLERGWVAVDEGMRTSIEKVYAVGDITGKYQLAHVASHQGMVAAGNAAGENRAMDYRAVPSCIFTDPEVASVGLTEREARDQYGDGVKVGRFPFVASGRALTLGDTRGFVKIVADSRWNEILGVHIIGPGATELIAEAVLAIKLECTAEELADAIHAHPTLSETLMEASLDLLRIPIHKM